MSYLLPQMLGIITGEGGGKIVRARGCGQLLQNIIVSLKMTGPLHTYTHSGCDCRHKTKPSNSNVDQGGDHRVTPLELGANSCWKSENQFSSRMGFC